MISTKGRYAIRLMIDLAEQPEGAVVPLEDIAERQGISKKYLESVVKLLVKGNLVKGTSGKNGGYRLIKKPQEYTAEEIIETAEGTLAVVACLNTETFQCEKEKVCKSLPMWRKYNIMVHDFFQNITLDDLVKGNV